jgi:hypothetical protein
MALATRFYNVCPVQQADEAVPAGYHIASLILQVMPEEITDVTWNDVTAPTGSLDDDIVGVGVTLLSGVLRHAPISEEIVYGLEDAGVDGTEPACSAPDNIVLVEGWTEQFECIGVAPALILIHAYVPDAGFAESAAPEPDPEEPPAG